MSTVQKFSIAKDIVRKNRCFGVQARTLEFNIKPIPQGNEPVGWIKDAITQIVLRGTEGLDATDKVGFTFCSKDFTRGQGWIAFKNAADVSVDDIFSRISAIYQSNSFGLNTDTFCLGVTSVRLPAGKGRGRQYATFDEECTKRKGIVCIKNKDNLCLPRALIVSLTHATKHPDYQKIRQDKGKLQNERALQLMNDAGVIVPAEGCGIPELQQFQSYLQNYKITVYQYGNKGRNIMFKGNGDGPSLNLLFHKGHFNVITSLTAAFCCSHYCEECHVPYNSKKDHRCGRTCFSCQSSPSCSKNELKISCDSCKRFFRGRVCFDNHIRNNICQSIRRCEMCFKIVPTERSHICGEIFCKICNKHCRASHLCYIQPDTRVPQTHDLLLVFYDLETRQERVQEDGSLLHEPNLCVFRQCCDICIDSNSQICEKCGVRLQILKCKDPIPPFVQHLLTMRKKFKNTVVIAHNGGGFDHQFVLNYILTQTDLTPDLIMRGTKLISLNIGTLKFLDSLNYFPMALAKLPQSFGFSEMKKGYFPHLFNRVENQNYVGPIPPIEFYSPGNLHSDARSTLIKWHSERVTEDYVFDFEGEIVEYCISDVDILTKACLKFRQLMLGETNVCPFTEATTIASNCNKVFRRNFLKPESIGVIPKGGYRWRDNQSKIAIQWILWEGKERCINIQHAANGSEAVIEGSKVDGWCHDTNQIFEFHGCFYHGCPRCYDHQRDTPLKNCPSETLDLRYDMTNAKIDKFKFLGYEVIEKWECDFRRDLSNNQDLFNYVETHPMLKNLPLDPRAAFYGGRTGNTVKYYKTEGCERIKYIDVCSLYPWVCKYGKFPVGHPEVLVGEEGCAVSLSSMSGLIKCTIIPPQDLFHPVLPQKMNSKLMFVLCRSCGENYNTCSCQHSEQQRALEGTWVIEEVVKAIELGYRILEIKEIWSYNTVQFSENEAGLFTEMMNKFIKVKQESSDWPENCKTVEEKLQYIGDFLQREDVVLEFSNIVDNPGLRSLAKLMLNSFWGKFGQRENQPKTSIVNQPAEFFKMMTDPSRAINSILPINEDTLIVNWEYTNESYDSLSTVNVVVASYVTALARLKLFEYLEQLGDRVLYYDTDSVIYVSRPGECDIPTSQFIGDMTNELECYGSGSYITEFVSGGPKNYAYKLWGTKDQEFKIVCKVKGISLNYAASQLINFNSIKDMILNPSSPVEIFSKQIRRTIEHEVITVDVCKKYEPVCLKRQFLPDNSSVPYGFKKSKTQ